MTGEQLSLFTEKPKKRGSPTWEDVQKGRAITVMHEKYSQPCMSKCMWQENIGNFGGFENCCYLFRLPVIDGRCPSTTHLEWTE